MRFASNGALESVILERFPVQMRLTLAMPLHIVAGPIEPVGPVF